MDSQVTKLLIFITFIYSLLNYSLTVCVIWSVTIHTLRFVDTSSSTIYTILRHKNHFVFSICFVPFACNISKVLRITTYPKQNKSSSSSSFPSANTSLVFLCGIQRYLANRPLVREALRLLLSWSYFQLTAVSLQHTTSESYA